MRIQLNCMSRHAYGTLRAPMVEAMEDQSLDSKRAEYNHIGLVSSG